MYDSHMEREDSKDGKKNMTDCTIPLSERNDETTTDSYTSDSLIDCELPEMVVFFQNNDYHAVKELIVLNGCRGEPKTEQISSMGALVKAMRSPPNTLEEDMPNLETGMLESPTLSTTDNFSGPISYSGSSSLQSNSSTTSAKSFAFPILHTEWYASPERMAKGDRSQFRKDQSWRNFFCCAF